MISSSTRSRLQTLRLRYESERRRGRIQTALGLIALCAVALTTYVTIVLYALSGGSGSFRPTGAALLVLLLLAIGTLLLAGFFFFRSLIGMTAQPAAAGEELRLNPGLASPGSSEIFASETLISQYGAAAGALARQNEIRGRRLAVGGWTLAGGLFFPVLLLVWTLLSAGPWKSAGATADSEIDGACCLFEDRRPVRD